jgi:hypothetical protein
LQARFEDRHLMTCEGGNCVDAEVVFLQQRCQLPGIIDIELDASDPRICKFGNKLVGALGSEVRHCDQVDGLGRVGCDEVPHRAACHGAGTPQNKYFRHQFPFRLATP